VTLADVTAVVGETVEASTDPAIDAALLGDHEALERGLERLRAEGASLGGLGTLTLRHLFALQSMRAAMDAGSGAAAALDHARPPILKRRRPAMEAVLRRWPDAALADARRRIDAAIALSRRFSALEAPAISEALHGIALVSRRLRRETAAAPGGR
jgi:DNA polymerase III delta subunit